MAIITEREGFWEALAAYFERFHLPCPRKDDLVALRDEIAVALTDYGCLFRITSANRLLERQGLALQPLHEAKNFGVGPLNFVNIRLYAGVETVGIEDRDFKRLDRAFNRQGLKLQGSPLDDCGYIPFTLGKKTVRLPLLIDVTDIRNQSRLDNGGHTMRESLVQLADSCAEILRLKPSLASQLHKAQNHLYAELRDKCAAMFNAPPDRREDKARIFWAAMHAATKERMPDGTTRLSAGWTKPVRNLTTLPDSVFQSLQVSICEEARLINGIGKAFEKKSSMNDGGIRYASTLRESPFHLSILGPDAEATPVPQPSNCIRFNQTPSQV